MNLNKKYTISFVTILSLLYTTPLFALEFQFIGPRALAMGGAQVAIVQDATAFHWNPAMYGFFGRHKDEDIEEREEPKYKKFEASLPFGAGVDAHNGLIKEISDINNYDFTDLSNKAQNGTISTNDIDDLVKIVSEVRDLNKDDLGVTIHYDTGLSFRAGHFGISTLALGNVSAVPSVDSNNLAVGSAGAAISNLAGTGSYAPTGSLSSSQRTDLLARIDALSGWDTPTTNRYLDRVDQTLSGFSANSNIVEAIYSAAQSASLIDTSAGSGNFSNNNSKAIFKGAAVLEVPFSYGYAFNDHLAIGANLKYMRGITYYKEVSIFDVNTDDLFNDFSEGARNDFNIGIDLGAIYKADMFSVGIVGKNLNSPKFDYAGPGDFEVNRQFRAGGSFNPVPFITIAADLDLTTNKTTLSDSYNSRLLSIGSEFRLFEFLALRIGTYRNLAAGDLGQVYTAGFGLNFIGIKFDLAAGLTSGSDKYNGKSIPSSAKIAGSLAWEF